MFGYAAPREMRPATANIVQDQLIRWPRDEVRRTRSANLSKLDLTPPAPPDAFLSATGLRIPLRYEGIIMNGSGNS